MAKRHSQKWCGADATTELWGKLRDISQIKLNVDQSFTPTRAGSAVDGYTSGGVKSYDAEITFTQDAWIELWEDIKKKNVSITEVPLIDVHSMMHIEGQDGCEHEVFFPALKMNFASVFEASSDDEKQMFYTVKAIGTDSKNITINGVKYQSAHETRFAG